MSLETIPPDVQHYLTSSEIGWTMHEIRIQPFAQMLDNPACEFSTSITLYPNGDSESQHEFHQPSAHLDRPLRGQGETEQKLGGLVHHHKEIPVSFR